VTSGTGICCRHAAYAIRAAQAEVAAQAGYSRVYNVLGGFEQGWRPAGLPWVKG